MVTVTDTLTGEVWWHDCGPVSLALRPALLVGSAAHCHIGLPALPPVAAVIEELPTEDVVCAAYRLSITCDTPRYRGTDFLWEQEEFSISLDLSPDDYTILQKGREAEFCQTGWWMEADDMWVWRNSVFARISFHATAKGWSATRGWTRRGYRNHCEAYILPMLRAALADPRGRIETE
jgi:hypothetical protein